MTHIAIIGAGLAGLTLARRLTDKAEVTVFEKSGGVGGRLATRYHEAFSFDHGAQYFTIRSRKFHRFLAPYLEAGILKRWPKQIVRICADGSLKEETRDEPLYTAVPKMNALGKALSEGFSVVRHVTVAAVFQQKAAWHLKDKAGSLYGPFDWVVSTAPAPQTAALLPEEFAHMAAVQKSRLKGCFALMLGFANELPLSWDGAFVDASPIGWLAINSTKPDRPEGASLLIQSTNDWAEAHLEEDQEWVAQTLIEEACERMGVALDDIGYQSLHRWRYAAVSQAAGQPFLLDADRGIAACGDWCLKGRVEAAFESADQLANAIETMLR